MKTYFAYTRVSTVKQGEKGSSLQEQKAAIEAYAGRHSLTIAEWFEEKETAAKQGRPVFLRMVKDLEEGRAAGVVTHKIDRSARNLRDWARLGELLDRGIELHFAHESIDLLSRGGRLSADIQAVVAADYIRNLRDEVKKGFYGRLKQGLYPLKAPIGYLDQGGGRPKTIDPVRGPLVAKAFALYATGDWSLESLSRELYERGLRTKNGRCVTRNGLSTMLNNPFYIGLIRIETAGEMFQGVHRPLVEKTLFDRVQAILRGRLTHKANIHRFRYQRTLACSTCGRSLTASCVKGHVYYRCATRTCPTTSLKEEAIDRALFAATEDFSLSDDTWMKVEADIETALAHRKTDMAAERQNLALALAALDAREARLTDALVDGVLERSAYLARKEQLLSERTGLLSRKTDLEDGDGGIRREVEKSIELIKALGNMPKLANDDELRDLLKDTVSNLSASGKSLAIAWRNPFAALVSRDVVPLGGPTRIKYRTGRERAKHLVRTIVNHCAAGAAAGNRSENVAA